MDTIIMNSQWHAGKDEMPQYFTNKGPITYDNFCVNGNQTCSITMMKKGGRAKTQYEVPIPVQGQQALTFGFCCRCIGADCCFLQVDYYDANHCLMDSCKEKVTNQLTADFNTCMARFMIPCHCTSLRLSIRFTDRITACTYCAPFAYFC